MGVLWQVSRKAALLTIVCMAAAAPAAQAGGLSMQRLELPAGPAPGTRLLKVALVPEARCNFGDLDAISLDLQSAGAKLQVTAEILGGPPAAFHGQRSGDGYVITLPEFRQPTVLGIFLCTGREGEQTPCREKQLQGYDQMFAPYAVDVTRAKPNGEFFGAAPPSGGGQAGERIYFFRFVVASNGAVEFPSGRMSDEGYTQFMTTLERRNPSLSNPALLRARLMMLGATLGSEPLAVGGDRLQLTLPYYFGKKCQR